MRLTAYYGCMFSEKSGGMLSQAFKESKYRGKNVIFFKPRLDTRSRMVASRIGLSAEAVDLPTDAAILLSELRENGTLGGVSLAGVDIVCFDEVQFYTPEIVSVIKVILETADVMAAGLNLDYLGNPIGSVGELILIADEAVHKTAYCSVCGEPALYSQRIVNGVPFTKAVKDMVLIGDSESYEPRCRKHFVKK